jgi:hypothetical protein
MDWAGGNTIPVGTMKFLGLPPYSGEFWVLIAYKRVGSVCDHIKLTIHFHIIHSLKMQGTLP